MNRLDHKTQGIKRRQSRVRSVVRGAKEHPRLSVKVSNVHISAQIIDDNLGKTLFSVTTAGSKEAKGTLSQKATWVGVEIGKKAKTHKIKKVVFDRGERLYHGRVKALADAARESGLEF